MNAPLEPQAVRKPVGGFVVVLVVAVFIGAWLYVDNVKNELEMKFDAVSAELAAARARAAQSAPEKRAPLPEGRRTFAASLGAQRFQVDLPVGHFLSVGEDMTRAYVRLEASDANPAPTPDMVIHVVTLAEARRQPSVRSVPTPDGSSAFLLERWEDQAWDGFEAAAGSFKAL